ncbi:major facilitator superfamily domain-containing protein [Stachybotrys elegans]|uniref:Major facilitator superfamily domain-containing protein n=1 Tax=Stachybotrys elegans TaxID=80388 RepID=A0A8K0WX11_9HYPO|nr:major facilitator superfamily domain-containing protein [Stachybotrys elegans]
MSDEEKALLWKQDLRIVPISAGIYFLCFLDRSNIGNARILNSSTNNNMQDETNMTDYEFIIALMVFLVAYAVFEVPSNILLKKLRPSRWIAFLMFCWGAMTISLGGTHNFGSVTAVRFLLGMFEAGLFPGLIYYLTFWYKHNERSVRVAFILASATLSGAFGGAIAYGIGHMNGAGGLAGWRWLFIIEGIPSCLSAFIVLFFLPDYPERVHWLNEAEKDLATQRLYHEGSKESQPTMTWADAKETLTDWRLYAHYAIYFAVSPAFASLSLFSPSITAGLGYEDLEAQLMTVPPWAVAYVCQIAIAYSADHFNARGVHTAGAALVGAIGFIVSGALPPDHYSARYGGLILATAGSFACIPPMLGWLTSNIFSTAATGLAIAINVSVGGGLGQIPGVWIYRTDERADGYPTGHWTNASLLLVVALISLGLRWFYGHKNKQLAARAEREGVQAMPYKL